MVLYLHSHNYQKKSHCMYVNCLNVIILPTQVYVWHTMTKDPDLSGEDDIHDMF